MNVRDRKRLPAIEYMRGISMLGVIGIHIGSQYITNPLANVNLVALFEIVTRFAVPIFFFISAFGLFYRLDPDAPFDYKNFMRRRFKTVLIPYLAWSLFYLLHDGLFYRVGFPAPDYLLKILFFGVAKYQLYFLVILLWFYALMPLWIAIVRRITPRGLFALLIVQTAFDYFSSYNHAFNAYVWSLPPDDLLRWFLYFRLNWLVLHYVFIFVLGGWLAVRWEQFDRFMRSNVKAISIAFVATLIGMLAHYNYIVKVWGLPPEAAINIAHQLSPIGILYTIAASIFFFALFTTIDFGALSKVLSMLGRHSYFAYLVHPLVITYLMQALQSTGRLLTAPTVLGLYLATVVLSLTIAAGSFNIGKKFPLINKLTIGK
ncbi:MAG: acyltransferase [Selenomonadaceae bacterium]|nr:acyltransferase [Selenomonadaceae bacterium]